MSLLVLYPLLLHGKAQALTPVRFSAPHLDKAKVSEGHVAAALRPCRVGQGDRG